MPGHTAGLRGTPGCGVAHRPAWPLLLHGAVQRTTGRRGCAKPGLHQALGHGAEREALPGPHAACRQRKQGLAKPARGQGQQKPGVGVTGAQPPPRALSWGWPPAQFTSHRSSWKEHPARARAHILCKGCGDPQGPLCRTQDTQRAPCTGAAGLPPAEECEQQGQSEGNPGSFPPTLGFTDVCRQQGGTDAPLIRGRDSTVDRGAGQRLAHSRGSLPRGVPYSAVFYTPLGLHRGPATPQGLRSPQGAAGSQRAKSPGLSRKGEGKVPSALPSPPWDRIRVQSQASSCHLDQAEARRAPASAATGVHASALRRAARFPLCTSGEPRTGPRGQAAGGTVCVQDFGHPPHPRGLLRTGGSADVSPWSYGLEMHFKLVPPFQEAPESRRCPRRHWTPSSST